MSHFAYRQLKIAKDHGYQMPQWVYFSEDDTSESLVSKYGQSDLLISLARYSAQDIAAARIDPLYFWVTNQDIGRLRRATLEIWYYLSERFSIPQDSVDACFDGEASVILQVTSSTLGGQSASHMSSLNRHLARQMVKDGLENLDIDVYLKGQFVRMPNSLNSATGRIAIPVQMKELMYLDSEAILELAKEPRPEDSFALPRCVPEAAEWFREILQNEERRHARQRDLRQVLLREGWQIPPCIRRLHWVDLSRGEALETCRIIGGFYAFVNANEGETWQHVLRIDRRHGLRDYPRLRAIVTFGVENPAFVGCAHPLLQRFCPAGKCFMTELMNEIRQPFLFGNKQAAKDLVKGDST